jgi:hypothetical protein
MFVTMNLYEGGHEIERTMVTHETQGFLDKFELSEDNNPISCVLVLLGAIDVVVVLGVWGGGSPALLSYPRG